MFRSPAQPRCRYCGGKIGKHTTTRYFVPEDQESFRQGSLYLDAIKGTPRNRAEAQRLVNQKIVAVRYSNPDVGDGRKHGRFIDQVSLWDGESYVDQFFCGGTCVDRFAYAMARAGYMMPACKGPEASSFRGCTVDPSGVTPLQTVKD